MTKVSGFLRPGCVVEYMQGNAVQLAWVLEESSGRLRLLTATKREAALAASRVLPWSGPEHPAQASRQEILEHLAAHHRRREELEAQVQALEIWDLAQGEV
ncbi:MAG TPA: ribonuclease II, partial [Desulfovibrio sp.]|nr:ribonuclease II [Desulfovibrio sp.]